MRILDAPIVSCLSLLLANPPCLSPVAASSLPLPPSPNSHGIPTSNGHDYRRSWLVRARNSMIESIWSVTPDSISKAAKVSPCRQANPPQKVLARYGGDVVLRFDVKSHEEAEALASAVHVLFLDVWEFTTDWVDIRISKDVVSFANRILGTSTKPRTRYHRYLAFFQNRCSMLTLR